MFFPIEFILSIFDTTGINAVNIDLICYTNTLLRCSEKNVPFKFVLLGEKKRVSHMRIRNEHSITVSSLSLAEHKTHGTLVHIMNKYTHSQIHSNARKHCDFVYETKKESKK